jgi:phage terminase large subunit
MKDTDKIIASSKYYIPFLNSDHRYCVLMGGRSSGKSYQACLKIVLRMMTDKYFKGVVLRKVFADIKDSVFEQVWEIIKQYDWEDKFHYTKNPLQLTHVESRNTLLARGLDKPAKLKSIANPNFVFVEEADEIGFDDFIKSDTSIRHPDPSVVQQLVMSFNPESEEGWINEHFFPPKHSYEKEDGSHTYIKSVIKNTLILHTTYKHNDFCSEGNIQVIEQLRRLGEDSNYYRVYVKGLWGNALKGLVFDNVNYCDEFPAREDCKHFGYGLDFGFTNDPTAIVKCALAHGNIYLEEKCHKTGLVNTGSNSICSEFEAIGITKGDTVIADSAEPKSIAEINREGYSIRGVKKGKDSIESGIALMKQYPIYIVGSSPNLKKEMKSYKYKENKQSTEVEFSNTPIDAWNHLCDASRYWCVGNIRLPYVAPRVHCF